MPGTPGWEQPDWESMRGDELRDHLKRMRKIGEAYQALYATGQWPIPEHYWQAWWDQTTADFKVYFGHYDAEYLVSEMMASLPPPGKDPSRAGMRQDDVHIHPFPGGCVFEQVLVITAHDGTETRIPGVHVFYLNPAGKVVRSHEYYDLSKMASKNMERFAESAAS